MIRSKHMIGGQWVFPTVWSSIRPQSDIFTGLPEAEKDPRPIFLVLGIEGNQASWCQYHADSALEAKWKAIDEFGYSSAWAYKRRAQKNESYDQNARFFGLLRMVQERLSNGHDDKYIRKFVHMTYKPVYEGGEEDDKDR